MRNRRAILAAWVVISAAGCSADKGRSPQGGDGVGRSIAALKMGAACRTNADCASGFCVDKVCCESACGGGVSKDCQACANKLTGQPDGLCRPALAGTECRDSQGECDPEEACDGASLECPPDVKSPAGTACTPDTNPCTVDACDGVASQCTHPAGNAGALCRASTGECDPSETCTGSSSICPPDLVSTSGTPCTDDGTMCTSDQCDGASAACQHAARPNCSPHDGVPRSTFTVVECGTNLGTGACTVSAPESPSGWRRYRGSVLAPNQVFHGGDVLVDPRGVITCVGCNCESPAGTVDVACPDGVVSPGLINTHDHISFSNNKPLVHDKKYLDRQEWRFDSTLVYNKTASNDPNVVAAAELRQMLGGTTSLVAETGAPGFLRNLTQIFGLDLAPMKPARFQTFPLGDADGVYHPDCQLNPTHDTAASLFGLDAYLPHVAEGIDDNAHGELPCISAPGPNDLITPITTVIHQVATNATDARVLHDSLAWVSWAPRSNISLYGNTAPVTLLHAAGIPIALGTDWILTGSMNLLRELRCADSFNADYLGGYFSDFELWQMVTTNAAFAAGADRVLGMLKPGYLADIAIFDGSARHDHRAVVAGELQDVRLVVKGGQPEYGDEAVMAALAPSCTDGISVCGTAKRGCAASEIGVSFADLTNAIAPYYDLVQCGEPAGEPTCIPSRDGEYPVSAVDTDADGLPDSVDLCPTVFSPVRPMDGGAQPDVDHDGIGDVCDACPNGPCTVPAADDIDGDGAPNGADVCPDVADQNQEDFDGDGKGDACDGCPMFPNAGYLPCPKPLPVVRNPAASGHPVNNEPVFVQSLSVTAVRPRSDAQGGFYAQLGSGEDFGGIFVFTGPVYAPDFGIAPGMILDVLGNYQGDTGLSQIVNPWGWYAGNGVAAARVVDPADVAQGGPLSEACESVLLSVGPVTVINSNPDAPRDFDEFLVTGGLRVDDELTPALGNDYPVGTSFQSITGVLGFRAGNHKLLPRSASEIVP